MKKKFLGLMAIVVVAVVAALNVNLGAQEEALSSVGLDNVEALAGGESDCCIGSAFRITPISGGWECVNDIGNSCCPVC